MLLRQINKTSVFVFYKLKIYYQYLNQSVFLSVFYGVHIIRNFGAENCPGTLINGRKHPRLKRPPLNIELLEWAGPCTFKGVQPLHQWSQPFLPKPV